MAVQLSVTARNNRLDSIETTIGTAPLLIIRTGSPPATCATADSGSVLATLTLPSNWLADAASGAKAKAGTWSGTASAGGTAGHFRIKDSGAVACHLQGTVTASGGGGDAELQQATADIANGEPVTVSAFTLTDGNA